jgi:hypothetical protein
MGHLTLREALASDRLDIFVREQQEDGAELVTGSELERGLALLITQRRSLAAEGRVGNESNNCNDRPIGGLSRLGLARPPSVN